MVSYLEDVFIGLSIGLPVAVGYLALEFVLHNLIFVELMGKLTY